MVAVTIEAPRRARAGRVPAPAPGPGQVLVRVEGCGVCGSSLPLWEGRPWFSYPLAPGAPGHEGWGAVEELGEGVDRRLAGRRVAFLSGSAFAELDVAEAATVVPLPPQLDGLPFPGEALGCAFNVLRRSGIEPGDRVAVVGAGFLGATIVALAADAGAEVTALARRARARQVALELGAARAVGLDGTETDFDVVVETGGVQATLDVASTLVRERGRLVIAGFHQDSPRTIDLQRWNWRGLDVVNAHERDPAQHADGIAAAVEAVAGGRLDPTPLYTHVLPVGRAAEAFDLARTRPDGFMKALVTAA
jgi:threonine dehydrogenase-like Zn-dependent dehydrogenase